MATIKWRKDSSDDTSKLANMDVVDGVPDGAEAAMQVAVDLAKAVEGQLVTVYSSARDTAKVVVDTKDGLLVFTMPHLAPSLDDVAEEATHYTTGLQLAEEIVASGLKFASAKGRASLMTALTLRDARFSVSLSKRWMEAIDRLMGVPG